MFVYTSMVRFLVTSENCGDEIVTYCSYKELTAFAVAVKAKSIKSLNIFGVGQVLNLGNYR
jgi:hypothetical protein